jgi:hypothetical protein
LYEETFPSRIVAFLTVSRFIPRPGWFRSALAGVVGLCVLMAGLMAASPELHEHLHHDAGHADHTCLATMIADGGCESVSIAPLLVAACITWTGTVVLMRSQWVRPLFIEGGLLVHAPPVSA